MSLARPSRRDSALQVLGQALLLVPRQHEEVLASMILGPAPLTFRTLHQGHGRCCLVILNETPLCNISHVQTERVNVSFRKDNFQK